MLQHIDTAEMYKNESEIGKGLQELFKSGAIKREDLFVTSKLWTEHHPADQVRPGLMDSLSRLQLDYLDLYLIHWYSPCTSSNWLLVLRHCLCVIAAWQVASGSPLHRARVPFTAFTELSTWYAL